MMMIKKSKGQSTQVKPEMKKERKLRRTWNSIQGDRHEDKFEVEWKHNEKTGSKQETKTGKKENFGSKEPI